MKLPSAATVAGFYRKRIVPRLRCCLSTCCNISYLLRIESCICISYNLIITGNHRGEVWNFTDVGVQPCCEPQDFLGWFELWLDNQNATDYFKDFVYDEADCD